MTTATNPSFYMECVDHMCRLEQTLERLKKTSPGANAQKLDELRSMIAEVVDFSISNKNGNTPSDFTAKVEQLRQKMAKLTQLVKGQSWSSIKKLLGGGQDGKAFEIKICYDELKTDFMRFTVEHFVDCVKKFEVAKAEKQAYLESIDAFTLELDRVW